MLRIFQIHPILLFSTMATASYQQMELYLSQALESVHSAKKGKEYSFTVDPQVLQTAFSIPPPPELPPASTSGSFNRGFIMGQLSVLVVIVLFIKFFIFSEAAPVNAHPKRPLMTKLSHLTRRKNGKGDQDREGINESILENTYYDVKNHPSESMDWFNVLLAQLVFQVRREALFKDNIYHSLDTALNSSSAASYTSHINITEINIGDDYPIFSNCRVVDNNGRLEVKLDVDISDTLTLAGETSFLINKPKPGTASLPGQFTASIVRFSGCLSLSLVTIAKASKSEENMSDDEKAKALEARMVNINSEPLENDRPADETALLYYFAPDFRLEIEFKSLIGSRAKLENTPRVSSMVENLLRNWFIENYIEPKFQIVKIPSLWPEQAPESATPSTPSTPTTPTMPSTEKE